MADSTSNSIDQLDAPLVSRAAMFAGLVAIAIIFTMTAGWTGTDNPTGLWPALDTLIRALPITTLWLTAAVGFGWPARHLLFPHVRDGLLLQTAVGIAILLWLDAALGALGILFVGGSMGAWVTTMIGLALLGWQIKSHVRLSDQSSMRPHWLWWTAAPAIAVLLVASTSAPGWLWASEFGGYDALSYHLQLPREWIAAGRIVPLEHNVYSFLPGYVEAAYTHLALLRGDVHDAAYACQLLHACMALLTAITAVRVTQRIIGQDDAAPSHPSIASGVLLLGTPWVIVTGSLAYNELFTMLMLAAGMMVLLDERITPARLGIVIGLLAGAACGAKLTSVGFVAVPLGVAMIATRLRTRLATICIAGALAGLAVLLPWLARNFFASGNPVFPFMTGLFGAAHWSPEQIIAWRTGHFIDGGMGTRIGTGFDQFFRYGIGPNADQSEFEPWKPQWLILPWLGIVSCGIGIVHKETRRWAILLGIIFLMQLLFWTVVTHIKSRFMLPSAVPLAIMTGVGLHLLLARRGWTSLIIARSTVASLSIIWSSATVFVYKSERNGWPALMLGGHRMFTGDGMSSREQRTNARYSSPVILVNHVLPRGSHVLLIGDAKPYYYDLQRIAYQTTWDRGPMSQIIREHPAQPAQWIDALRQRGFTHVLIDAAMLDRWRAAGWGDPLLDAHELIERFDAHARLVSEYGNVRVYAL